MRNEVRNMDASIKARLKNIAKEYKKTFNLILQLYMQERLLYRLSVSEYKDNFILKGGLLLFSMSGFTGRPTRDMGENWEKIGTDTYFLSCIILKEDFSIFFSLCKMNRNQLWILSWQKARLSFDC